MSIKYNKTLLLLMTSISLAGIGTFINTKTAHADINNVNQTVTKKVIQSVNTDKILDSFFAQQGLAPQKGHQYVVDSYNDDIYYIEDRLSGNDGQDKNTSNLNVMYLYNTKTHKINIIQNNHLTNDSKNGNTEAAVNNANIKTDSQKELKKSNNSNKVKKQIAKHLYANQLKELPQTGNSASPKNTTLSSLILSVIAGLIAFI